MKNRLIVIAGILLAAGLLVGCSKKDAQAEALIEKLIAENLVLQAELDKARSEIAEQTLAAAIASQPLEKSEASFPMPGKWKITGTGKNRAFQYTAYMTISEINGAEFSAVLDWHDLAGSVAVENVKGAYNPQSRQITLTRGYGAKVDVPVFKGLFDDIDGETFVAYLSENGRDFTEGSWMDGGEWEAKWPENGVDFPEEYNPPMDFRPQWAWDDY